MIVKWEYIFPEFLDSEASSKHISIANNGKVLIGINYTPLGRTVNKEHFSLLKLLEGKKGEEIWTRMYMGEWGEISKIKISKDSKKLYYGTRGHLVALSENGNELWWYHAQKWDSSQDGRIIGFTDGDIYGVIDSNSRRVIWKLQTQEHRKVYLVSVSNNGKYIGFFEGDNFEPSEHAIVKVYTKDGKLKWEWEEKGKDPLIFLLHKIITLDDSSTIIEYSYAINDEETTIIWETKVLSLKNGETRWQINGELVGASQSGKTTLIRDKENKNILNVLDENGEIKWHIFSPVIPEKVFTFPDNRIPIYHHDMIKLYSSSGNVLHVGNLPGTIESLTASPNGKYLATVVKDNKRTRLYRLLFLNLKL